MIGPKFEKGLLAVIVCLALWARWPMLPRISPDFVSFHGPWIDFVSANKGWPALAFEFTDYAPPLSYFLVLLYYVALPFSKAAQFKLLPIFCDFALAYWIWKIVSKAHRSTWVRLLSVAAVLFCPSIMMNSSSWGQTDAVYAVGILASLYFLLSGRSTLCLLSFSFALSFKLQSIFFLPVLTIFALRKEGILKKDFALIPLVIFATWIPCLVAGRPLSSLFGIYISQTKNYSGQLSLNAPNFYAWISNSYYISASRLGMLAFIAILLGIMAWAVLRKQKPFQPAQIILVSFFISLIVPYLLPKMHERYFYLADVMSIVFAFYFPKYFWLAISVIFCSTLSYYPFLYGKTPIPIEVLAGIQTANLCFLLFILWKKLRHFGSSEQEIR